MRIPLNLPASLAVVLALALTAQGEAPSTRQPRPELALQLGLRGEARAVAYSRDGRWLASGGSDGSVELRNARSGELLHTFIAPRHISRVALSADGGRVAAAHESRISVWDRQTGLLVESRGYDRSVAGLGFTPAGELVTCEGGEWHRFRPGSRQPDLTSGYPYDSATRTALSLDGRRLATGSLTGIVRLWDTESGALLHELKGHTSRVDGLAFSPDGSTLLTAGADARLCFWHPPRGRLLRTVRASEPLGWVGFVGSGTTFVTGGSEGSLRVWEALSGKPLRRLAVLPEGIRDMACIPHAEAALVAVAAHREDTVRVWNASGGNLRQVLGGNPGIIYGAAFSPDGRTVASCGGLYRGTVRLWDRETGQLRRTLYGDWGGFTSVTYSPDGTLLAAAGSRQLAEVRLWDAASGKLLDRLGSHPGQYRSLAFTPDGRFLAAGGHCWLSLWDLRTRTRLLHERLHDHWINGIAFSPDGTRMATASADRSVRLWETGTGRLIHRLLENSDQWMTHVDFSADGSLLAAGSWDNTARVWEAGSGRLLHTLRGHEEDVNTLAFGPHGHLLATGSDDRTVRLWDAAGGKHLRTLGRHELGIEAVAFSPDGRTLASGSPDAQLQLWGLSEGRRYASLLALPGLTAADRVRPGLPLGETSGADDYLVITPGSYYSGTADADRFVRLRLQDELFPAECFQARFYRPDRVLASLAGREPEPEPPLAGPFPPRLLITSPLSGSHAGENRVTLTMEALDDREVRRVALYVNGRRVDPISGGARQIRAETRPIPGLSKPIPGLSKPIPGLSKPIPGLSKTSSSSRAGYSQWVGSVPLSPDESHFRVQAIAYDGDGLRSPREEIVLHRDARALTPGRLLALCVGISQYRDPRLQLQFAAKDARAVAGELLAQKQAGLHRGRLYADAVVKTLINEQATRTAIQAELDRLAAGAGEKDTVVLFLSGHGWRGAGRDFYLATHEVDGRRPEETALPWAEVGRRLAQLSARSRRVIVLLDACHAGSAATNENLVRALGAAGAGVMVLAGCGSLEVSLESARVGQGFFTQAILEAFRGQAPGGGSLNLMDFATYVRQRVPTLSEDAQHPRLSFYQEFDLDRPFLVPPGTKPMD